MADKIIIIYAATLGSGVALSKTIGVDEGPGYYIKAMGMGGYCKMLTPDELTPETLVDGIRLVQGNAALGNSSEGDVQTFRFVKTIRLACIHPEEHTKDAKTLKIKFPQNDTKMQLNQIRIPDGFTRRGFLKNRYNGGRSYGNPVLTVIDKRAGVYAPALLSVIIRLISLPCRCE